MPSGPRIRTPHPSPEAVDEKAWEYFLEATANDETNAAMAVRRVIRIVQIEPNREISKKLASHIIEVVCLSALLQRDREKPVELAVARYAGRLRTKEVLEQHPDMPDQEALVTTLGIVGVEYTKAAQLDPTLQPSSDLYPALIKFATPFYNGKAPLIDAPAAAWIMRNAGF